MNNTNNNILSSSDEIDRTVYQNVIAYLNQKAGTHYKPTTKATQKVIHARLSEGFTLEDFYTVIDHKTADWLRNPEFRQYLRPQTLFGTKFEAYLQQPSKQNLDAKHKRDTKAYEDLF